MEDQTSWKNHTFTLLVFTGIVVLCSIFFILGMLVGNTQGQKVAANTSPADAPKTDIKPESKEDRPDFTFYDAVKKEQPAVLEPPPTADPPPAPDSSAKANSTAEGPPAGTTRPENVVNYQIAAVRKPADAERLLDEVKKKGFRAFILAPAANDANPLFRVQVGPFADPIEAQDVKKKLETAGYQPLLKK
jgi:cell division septation protein DedD